MRRVLLLRCLIVLAAIAILEALCRLGVIDRFTMPPPSRIL
jgi:ABC-type nitrate/sulfonate/bicarbonate transport system permease component